MVVAVAMGLLGPGVLADDSDENDSDSTFGLHIETEPTEGPPEPPSAEEFARVEDLWHTVRTNLG